MSKTPLQLAIDSEANVLIQGDTGTGKSRLARRIHEQGLRKDKPFHVLNLATLHESTLESELFGHERGAFTGADRRKVGHLELSEGGTLFLDEIAELPLRLQSRLLEFVQTRLLTPVGGVEPKRINVRIIAATHRDLAMAVRQGTFRADLFHRLRVIQISIPALIERPDEFDSIFHKVLSEVCREQERKIFKISDGFASRVEMYSWPGNIRELRNVLEYAVLSARVGELTEECLPPWFGEALEENSAPDASAGDYFEAFRMFEQRFFSQALVRTGGRVNRAAQLVGMSPSTFKRRWRQVRDLPGKKLDLTAT